MPHVILSPHFDDAVYSCGGAIHHWVTRGEVVWVVTVMGGALPQPVPESALIHELHRRWDAGADPIATRQQEDRDAMALLGASLIQLPLPDCVYRVANEQVLYGTEASLWGDIHPADPALIYLSQNLLTEQIDLSKAHCYAPLGVGAHVDHRIVRDWALRLQSELPHLSLAFYTDYPYMRDQAKIDDALAQMPHADALHAEWLPMDERALSAKISAMLAYRSQISSFWADKTALRDDVTTNFVDEQGRFAERFWRY